MDILPPLVGQTSLYSLRHKHDYFWPICRLDVRKKSFSLQRLHFATLHSGITNNFIGIDKSKIYTESSHSKSKYYTLFSNLHKAKN